MAKTKSKLDVLSTLPIASWPFPRVLCGILLERSISHADIVFWPLMQIAAQGVTLLNTSYGRTDHVRNIMAAKLLETDFTHLLMLDIDHIHPVDIVQRLSRWVLHDQRVQVVGGLNFKRSEPYEPCCYYIREDGSIAAPAQWHPGSLIEVDAIGTGTILIAREVFEQLEPPWFYNDYSDVMADKWPGEDMGFSEKCRQAGIKMYVDTSTTSPHCVTRVITEATFRAYIDKHPDFKIEAHDAPERVSE